MTDLDKAREWASGIEHLAKVIHPDAQAAIEIIQSLPDQWVDAKNVQAMIDNYKHARDSNAAGTEGWVINHLMVSNLESLIPTPKLPTLADMTQEEQKACQWMQCEIDGQIAGILARVDEQRGHIWIDSGYSLGWKLENITPVPDLPKLQWPGSGDEPTIAQKEKVAPDQAIAKDVCNSEPNSSETPKSSIKPEDVPAGEPWIVEYDGIRHVGAREKGAVTYLDWALARLDGTECIAARDAEITLVSRLVPESHTLPEGMRLADHEEYGRVVVSPKVDDGGDLLILALDEGESSGAYSEYCKSSELTFLDGDQRA